MTNLPTLIVVLAVLSVPALLWFSFAFRVLSRLQTLIDCLEDVERNTRSRGR